MTHEPETVGEIQQILLRAVGPRREPTAAEAAKGLPVLARLLRKRTAEGKLQPKAASNLLGAYAAKVLDLRLREVLSEALTGTDSERRRRGGRKQQFDAFGPVFDA